MIRLAAPLQLLAAFVFVFCASVDLAEADDNVAARVRSGLVLLYDFAEPSGDWVRDRAGTDYPLDLKIEDASAVRRAAGALEIRGATLIRSDRPAKQLISAIKRAGELTVEAWLQPQSGEQSGPARIVTLSRDSSRRNFTLGQEGSKFDVRLRSTDTSINGLPSLSSEAGSLAANLTHVVYTRNRQGQATIWLNGERAAAKLIAGDFSKWGNAMPLALGNELNGSRSWRGTYHLVAVYRRALNRREVQQNYAAGSRTVASPIVARQSRDPRESHFELEVAPILANQCLECHDSLSRQGGLDLSKRLAAIAGGDSGAAFVAGNAAESLLWHSVEADEMPQDRQPLSEREKRTLKDWIDDGAVWSLISIDPAVYVHGGRPDATWLRRLTIPEYIETVRALFDIDISEQAHEILPPDVRADGFSNTAYNQNVDLQHVEAYQRLAEAVVQRIDIDTFTRQFVKNLTFTDKDMGELISKMGRRILRGPLENHEVVLFRGIPTTIAATEDGNMQEAVALIIEAMLQSPRFLYRIERQRGGGEFEPVNQYELASRLSYMMWGAPPDESLFRAAEGGDLYDRESIGAQVQRMLDDPRAVAHSERFFADWLNLGRLKNMQPNRHKFPDWNAELAGDMRRETLAFFQEVVWKQSRPLSDLLNAQVTFATPRLAKHYGLSVAAADLAGSDGELVRFDLSKSNARGGILTQGSLLTVGGDEASMVTRGLLVMHELLRGVVKDPPACVDTTPVPTKPGLSQRAIAEERIANATCGGCHSRFEPLAFGLEKFDGLGGYHERDEHGNELRDDGEIVFPGDTETVRYDSSRQLMDLMAGSTRVKESITWKLTQYSLGRPLTAADAFEVQAIHEEAVASGGTYRATMTAIATSKLVTMMQTEQQEYE